MQAFMHDQFHHYFCKIAEKGVSLELDTGKDKN